MDFVVGRLYQADTKYFCLTSIPKVEETFLILSVANDKNLLSYLPINLLAADYI